MFNLARWYSASVFRRLAVPFGAVPLVQMLINIGSRIVKFGTVRSIVDSSGQVFDCGTEVALSGPRKPTLVVRLCQAFCPLHGIVTFVPSQYQSFIAWSRRPFIINALPLAKCDSTSSGAKRTALWPSRNASSGRLRAI